jgi:hypothetical protein
MCYDSHRQRVVMFGGSPDYAGSPMPTTSMTVAQSETWEFDGDRWHFKTLDGPSARIHAAMAYDPVRRVTVLFGGVERSGTTTNDTWEYDGNTWVRRLVAASSPDRPSPRYGHAMAFDPVSQRVIMAGGNLSGTWAWDGAVGAWSPFTNMNGATDVTSLGSAMFYDSTGQRMVFAGTGGLYELNHDGRWDLFGPRLNSIVACIAPIPGRPWIGFTRNGGAYQYVNGVWQVLSSAAFASSRDAQFCLHEASGTIIGMTGARAQADSSGPYQWIYKDGQVSVRTGFPAPEAGYAPGFVFDESRGVCVYFGGMSNTNNIDGGTQETWELRGETWLRRATTGPRARYYAGLLYDPTQNATILKGGTADDLGVWKWDGAWTLINDTLPRFTGQYVTAYDPALGRHVYNNAQTTGFLEFRNGAFAGMNITPAQSSHTAAAYDPVRGGLVFAGGDSGSTYRVNGASASPINTLGSQPSRYLPAMAYDPWRQAIVVMGGFQVPFTASQAMAFPNSTYFLPSTVNLWSPVSFTSPAGRKFHRLITDTLSERLVMFGGSDHNSVMRETWKLARGPAAVARHPSGGAVQLGSDVSIYTIAKGGGVIEYQWFKDDAPLVDDGRITGATTDTLSIARFSRADVASYSVRLHNPCGTDTSLPAPITLRCIADFDGSGSASIDDLFIYLNAWFSTPADPRCDVDAAAGVSIDDLFVFIDIWFAGC